VPGEATVQSDELSDDPSVKNWLTQRLRRMPGLSRISSNKNVEDRSAQDTITILLDELDDAPMLQASSPDLELHYESDGQTGYTILSVHTTTSRAVLSNWNRNLVC
jgi:hypothetical protein